MEKDTVKCKFCGEDVEAGAGRCQHCGSLLDASTGNNVVKTEEPSGPLNTENEQEQPMDNEQASEQSNRDTTSNPAENVEKEERYQSNYGSAYTSDPRNANGNMGYQRDIPGPQFAYRPNPNAYGTMPMQRSNPLSNGLKVFLSVITAVIPGVGQLAGLIIAIVLMNTSDTVPGYGDRRSFGLALLISCIVIFVLTCLGCFVLALASNASWNL